MPDSESAEPVEIFFSYAHADEVLMNQVRKQLAVFQRQGRILKWHDRQIPPGAAWKSTIDERLRRAHIVLLFVSPDFLDSDYCYDVEVKVALERHERREARVIPIILKPCAWEASPLAKLQAVPADARPLTKWPDRDQACLDVANSIISIVDDVIRSKTDADVPKVVATLSLKAMELLEAAATDPSGKISKVNYDGGYKLTANHRDFTGGQPRREVAMWESALSELVRNGLVRVEGSGGKRFVVTQSGFETAGTPPTEKP